MAARGGALPALLRLGAVLVLIGAATLWWNWKRAPDYRVDRALRLLPDNQIARAGPVPLASQVREAWRVPVGQTARFHVVIPGEDASLRFWEGYVQGSPDLAVRLVRADGRRTELANFAASEAAWQEHRLPLPAPAGEEIDLELTVLDGQGRPGLGEVLLADVVLLSSGRPVDEADLPTVALAVVADLLAPRGSELRRGPPTFESARVDAPGPICLPLDPHSAATLSVESVPRGARLHLVILVSRASEAPAGSPAFLTVSAGDVVMARMALDEWAKPREGAPPRGELLLSVDLGPWAGVPLALHLEREGGETLFVGVREALLLARQTQRRQLAGDGSNVLLVLVDGLRPDRIGAWGYEGARTPTLDALAARGLRYERLVAPSSWSLPNVATLFTGVSPLVHGLGLAPERVLSPRVVTFAQSASWAGFTTACFTSSTAIGPATGLARGFERFECATLPAARLVERALDWLEEAGQFRWFLALHVDDPMPPHEPETADLARVARAPDPELVLRLRPLDSRPGAAEALAFEVGSAYDAEVAGVDRALGVLLGELEARGLLEQTLVVVVGTTGQEFYERGGRHMAQSLHDELVRVPAILAGPRIGDAASVQRVEPSLVALADLSDLVGYLGRLLAAASLESLPPPFGPAEVGRFRHSLLLPYPGVTRRHLEATRRGDLLLLHEPATGARELFDLASDPGATSDRLLDGGRAWAAEARSMQEAFEIWYRDEVLTAASRAVPWKP